ncbi:MAG TPA: complex I NDUFA9 subunit family protein [Stellaceae bacterium]|nr:complex I NDUFA9 subunit family protein [Stellaceae bacterium]
MRNRRVTILGASGFLGRYMVKHLAEAGAVIAAVGRHASRAGYLRPMGDVGQVAAVDADVLDDRALEAVIAGAEIVVNAVGILYERGAQTFDALHARLPVRIAAAAQRAGVKRILHVSALGADAQSPCHYARSKAAGEADLRAAFPATTVFRPSLVFGPEDDFFNRFAAYARVAPALPLVGGGATRFQPVYVADIGAATVAALAREDAVGRTYELAGPKPYSFRELMELILRETGRNCSLVSIPFGLASFEAAFLEFAVGTARLVLGPLAPKPPLTRDQVRLLRSDSVPAGNLPGLAELGVTPTVLELVLPTYLDRFRRGGRSWRARPA